MQLRKLRRVGYWLGHCLEGIRHRVEKKMVSVCPETVLRDLEKSTGKMDKDGNLDDVSLCTRGIFSGSDGSVVWKELGDSKKMQILETEYGTECVTSLREIARELIPTATICLFIGTAPEFNIA